MQAPLNEYVDGTLAARDRAAVEAHLAQCAGCRAALDELQALVVGARRLPRGIEPPRDLWGAIAARIAVREQESRGRGGIGWWRQRVVWGGALATAAAFVIAVGLYRLVARPPGSPVQSWVAAEADYQAAAAELARALAVQRDRLRPETVAVIERNLSLIDAAIRESRAALAHAPGSVELRELFAAAYRQKVELLRWAARVATSS